MKSGERLGGKVLALREQLPKMTVIRTKSQGAMYRTSTNLAYHSFYFYKSIKDKIVLQKFKYSVIPRN